jgi:small-conductance mechanosensitive channel
MPSVDEVNDWVHRPLVHLAGGEITVVSLVSGVAIVAAAYGIAGITNRAVVRLLGMRDSEHGMHFAIGKIVRYCIVILGYVVAMSTLGVRLDAILAASTVILVGIGVGLQNIAQNFISGLILLIERPVARGHFVRIGDTLGTVVDIGLRATHIVTRDEVTIIVPNSELVTARVTNQSVPSTNLRISVRVGVAYGTDTARVKEALLAVAAADPNVLRQPAPEVRFDDFGDSSLNFSLLVWIASPAEDLRSASRLRFEIDAAFRKANIEIPFPQREVRIRSDARSDGGKDLGLAAS